jgi:hypothetical protein
MKDKLIRFLTATKQYIKSMFAVATVVPPCSASAYFPWFPFSIHKPSSAMLLLVLLLVERDWVS